MKDLALLLIAIGSPIIIFHIIIKVAGGFIETIHTIYCGIFDYRNDRKRIRAYRKSNQQTF